MFDLLTGPLRLPAIQPPTTHLGMFTSAIVGFGDTTVELIRFGEPPETPEEEAPARLWGIAFEPAHSLEESRRELDRRDLPRLSPQVFEMPDMAGGSSRMWTNLSVGLLEHTRRARAAFFIGRLFGGLQQRQMNRMVQKASRGEEIRPIHEERMDSMNDLVGHGLVFLTEYDPGFYDPTRGRVEGHRALQEACGGSLGVQGIQEVIVGTRDIEVARSQWRRFFEPAPEVETGLWQPEGGPALRLDPSGESRLRTLVLRVSSLVQAQGLLRSERMLDEDAHGQTRIAPTTIGGLDIRLTDRNQSRGPTKKE
ncbi:hypothetical protein [Rubrobacter aplysinae]|uniref:hypothetical protein n=1 Tax=Rubrobacter aplysinae TaxID=909625 RepID=UPI00064C1F2A|nr:hypothetical protein [Rubrobacter aplysinae]